MRDLSNAVNPTPPPGTSPKRFHRDDSCSDDELESVDDAIYQGFGNILTWM